MSDTVAAIGTPLGEGGIGIIRISGSDSLAVLKNIFEPLSGWEHKEIVPKKMMFGRVIDRKENRYIDEALAVFMKAPSSYTGEDVVEINCHGSNISLKKTLELVLSSGVEPAQKGEFTKRAFLNGRIDLSQAEAVMDLISAKSVRGFNVAFEQIEGKLSKEVSDIRREQMDLLVDIAVNIEYPEEDIEDITYDDMVLRSKKIADKIEKLLKTADTGRIIKEGIKVCIVGKPNVGKSSLLNALLGEERAIVTDIPGTTRDVITEDIIIYGIPCRLVDTAGIRDTDDKIEKIGIDRTKNEFNNSDLIIFICEGNEALSEEDKEILTVIGKRDVLVLINKKDLGVKITKKDIFSFCPNANIFNTAVRTGNGVSEIKKAIKDMVLEDKVTLNDSVIITNARHKGLLDNALKEMKLGIQMAERKEAFDFIEFNIRGAWLSLGEIIGETVTDDIIDTIFERFCLGK